jgi:hypothetical protein
MVVGLLVSFSAHAGPERISESSHLSRRSFLSKLSLAGLGLYITRGDIAQAAFGMRIDPRTYYGQQDALRILSRLRANGQYIIDAERAADYMTLIEQHRGEISGETLQQWIDFELEGIESEQAASEIMERAEREAEAEPRMELIGNPVANPRVRILVHADFDKNNPMAGQYIEVYRDGQYLFSSWASTGKVDGMTPMEKRFSPHEAFDQYHSSKGGGHMDMFYAFYKYPASNGGTHMTEHPEQLGRPASIGCTRLPTFGALAVAKIVESSGGIGNVVLDISKKHPRIHVPTGRPPFLQVQEFEKSKTPVDREWQAEFDRVKAIKNGGAERIYQNLATPADPFVPAGFNPMKDEKKSDKKSGKKKAKNG